MTLFVVSIAWLSAPSCTSAPRQYDDAGAPDGGPDAGMPGWRLACATRAGGEEILDVESEREGGRKISVLDDGSVYLVGAVAEAAVFGQGEPNETQFPGDVGWSDGFLARYAPDCTLDWVRRIGSFDEEQSYDVAALEDGSAVVVGFFRSEWIVFGEGEPNETTLTSEFGATTGFVARYRPDGGLLWAVRIPTTDETHLYAFTVHALLDGRILVSGTLLGTAWPGEPFEVVSGPGEWDWDGFLAWLDAQGEFESAVRICTKNQLVSRFVAVLEDGSIAVAVPYGFTEIFGEGGPNETALTCALQENESDCAALAKYDAEGRLVWVRDLGVTRSVSWHASASTDSSILLAGHFWADPTDPDLSDAGIELGEDEAGVLVAKFSAEDGSLEWARLGTAGLHVYNGPHVATIPLPEGGILALISFGPALEFEGDDEGQQILESDGFEDIALVRLSAQGEILWMYRLGDEGEDEVFGGGQLEGESFWLTGGYLSDPFVATSGHNDDVPLPLAGSSDAFLMRFDAMSLPSE